MATQLAYAQQPTRGERIEVTGSRIPLQENVESHSPISVISAEDIKIEGTRSVESLLNNMPQVFADQNGTVANGASGTATVNLRGLGADRTLVLMNGRRMPMGSVNTVAPDLNQIPASLVKRIEILTGGAGAVYGSDAVAGVVNFIMNDKFEGVQIDLNYSFYNHDQQNPKGVADIVAGRGATNPREFQVPGDKSADGKIGDIAITIGSNFANGKGNGTLFFAYKNVDALLASERDFSACALGSSAAGFSCGGSGTSATGRITNLTTGRVLTVIDSSGTARTYNNALDQFNYGPFNHFQRPTERYSAAAFANYDINSHVKAYGEFNFHDDNSVAQIAPGGIFGNIATIRGNNPLLSASWRTALGLTNSPDSTVDVVVQRRNVEGGGRVSEYRHTSFREVVGLKGDIGKWNYDVFAEAAKVVYSQVQGNYFLNQRIDNALDVVNVNGQAVCRSVVNGSDPNCVPYNVFSLGGVTPEQLAYLQVPGFQKGGTQQSIYGTTLSSDLGEYGIRLPAAKNGVSVAVGAERRTEKLDLDSDVVVSTGSLSGSGGPTQPVHGKYTVNEFYGEVRVPLIDSRPMFRDLSVSGSLRRSNYSTDISTTTYGAGVDWSPTKAVKLRGSYQNAVRAPNLYELFLAQGNNLFDMDEDPCAGPTPTATRAQCARTGVTAAQYGNIQDSPAGQYNYLQGGNPNLEPEKAKTYTVGLVLTPMPNLSATIDYFDIKIDKTISNLDSATVVGLCLQQGLFCDLIQRDRLGTLWLLDEGRVIGTNQNIGGTRTSGIDLAVNYNHPLGRMGGLGISFIGTWLRTLEIEEVKGLGIYDCVGLYGANKCGVPSPEWRHKLRFNWATPWNMDFAVTWRHMSEVILQGTSSNPLLTGTVRDIERALDAQNYLDIAASWAVTKWFTVRGGINNITDRDPPLTSQQGPSVFGNNNTFPGTYDALGRKVFVNATLKF
ncbi:MAG: TonB-dependent receptor [Usitatibacter sp.]